MNKEEKELLLMDLSARLPYGVKCKATNDFKESRKMCSVNPNARYCIGVEDNTGDNIQLIVVSIEDVKPYLFPLSSMTEGQKEEFNSLTDSIEIDSYGIMSSENHDIYHNKPYFECVDLEDMVTVIDWLNAHHFDFRNLIDRGLAIDCTNLNIY